MVNSFKCGEHRNWEMSAGDDIGINSNFLFFRGCYWEDIVIEYAPLFSWNWISRNSMIEVMVEIYEVKM